MFVSNRVSKIIFWRLHHFLGRDEWFWKLTPQKRRHDKLVEEIHAFTEEVIKSRRQTKMEALAIDEGIEDDIGIKKRRALLDILLESSVNGRSLSNTDIQEEVDNFMFAGHDTTTSAIEFLLFNLAKYPDIQNKVYDEIVQVFGVDNSESATLTKLNDLNYLDLVIKESLRLYPSVPLIGRYIKEDIEVSKYSFIFNYFLIIILILLLMYILMLMFVLILVIVLIKMSTNRYLLNF